MKPLHLVLNKKWFDQILSGQKTTEYREVKPFWEKRLSKPFTKIIFQLGYSKNAPKIICDCVAICKEKIIHEHFLFKEVEVFSLSIDNVKQYNASL